MTRELRLKDIGELEIIRKIRESFDVASGAVIIGIGDDAAVLANEPASHTVATTDTLVEDVHFQMGLIHPRDLGYKAIAAAVSDLAAMAAQPRYALVALALDASTQMAWVESLYQGIKEAVTDLDMVLVGGDTSASQKAFINVTALGAVDSETYCLRSAGQPGDSLCVTGNLGAAAAGFELLKDNSLATSLREREDLIRAHVRPRPRVAEASIAAKWGVRAIEDISDGLATDLSHLCTESRIGVRIWEERLPLAPGVAEVGESLGRAASSFGLYGGEDYELLMAVPEDLVAAVKEKILAETGTTLTEIGRVFNQQPGITMEHVDGKSQPLVTGGYEHFREATGRS